MMFLRALFYYSNPNHRLDNLLINGLRLPEFSQFVAKAKKMKPNSNALKAKIKQLIAKDLQQTTQLQSSIDKTRVSTISQEHRFKPTRETT
jgi:hypothetical protein